MLSRLLSPLFYVYYKVLDEITVAQSMAIAALSETFADDGVCEYGMPWDDHPEGEHLCAENWVHIIEDDD